MFFYHPQPKFGSICGENAKHLVVMRVKVGEQIYLTDLQGGLYLVQIETIDKKTQALSYKIIQSTKSSLEAKKIIFQAQIDKLYLAKMVELAPFAGVSQIFFFKSEFSPPQTIHLERLQKILIASCCLAESLFLPEITMINSYPQLLDALDKYRPQWLDCASQNTLSSSPEQSISSVLVGPEGGWSAREKDSFRELGLSDYSLGSIVLPSWLAGFTAFERLG